MAGSDRDTYRRAARWYDQLFGSLNAGLRGLGLKMFPPREGMDVLDVGCGTGIQLASYQLARCRVSGIDASSAMLAVARRRLGEEASLRLGDATRLPYPDEAFDLVLASTVLHEMDPGARAAALAEIRRVLRPGGRILLTDFEPGPVRPGRGWITKAIITASEVAAGRIHHRNYRHFIAHGGLLPLLDAQGFSVDQRRIVSGGAIGLYLALPRTKAAPPARTPAGPTRLAGTRTQNDGSHVRAARGQPIGQAFNKADLARRMLTPPIPPVTVGWGVVADRSCRGAHPGGRVGVSWTSTAGHASGWRSP